MTEKINRIPQTLRRYRVPTRLLADSAQTLRQLGGAVKEAVILWQGRVVTQSEAEITKIIVPHQVTGPLHFNVPLEERLRIVEQVTADRQFVLIQLHTHPFEAFHSKADDVLAITKHTGALSIVIPNFGMQWDGDLRETAIYFHLGAAVWRRVRPDVIPVLFEIVP